MVKIMDNPYEQMDDLGGRGKNPYFWFNTHIHYHPYSLSRLGASYPKDPGLKHQLQPEIKAILRKVQESSSI